MAAATSTVSFGTNSYAGEVLDDLLMYASEGNDTFQEGLIHIKSGIQHKYTLPHISLGDIVQDNVPTPTSSLGGPGADGENTYKFAERYLEPQDFMIYLEFNPREYEKFWKPFQPDGNLVFRELDPKVQAAMLRLLLDKKDEYIGDSIWCGAKGGTSDKISSDAATNVKLGGKTNGGNMKYFDGVIKRILDNVYFPSDNEKLSGQVTVAGNTVLDTGEKIEKALYSMYTKCPKHLRKNKNLKFIMGWELWDIYDQYLSNKDSKYTENADVNKFRFKGKRIVVINGIPEQTIVLGKFTADMDSCLWMGVDYASDQNTIVVSPLQNNSELWFFQMRLKMDVNIVLPSDIIVWTTYKVTEAAG